MFTQQLFPSITTLIDHGPIKGPIYIDTIAKQLLSQDLITK